AHARLEQHLRRQRTANLLQAMTRQDYLTELANRLEFDRRLDNEWLRCGRDRSSLAVIMVDIDHFKRYNDHYGHAIGDDCLRQVAKALAGCARRPADLISRYGGEEFALLLPDTDLDGAMGVAEVCCEAVRAFELDHADSPTATYVTISAGAAAAIPVRGTSPDSLVQAADNGLYLAKDTGRNRAASIAPDP
ncbi:MAG: diguanylate cyclase (GGDEF)-like protein, partial [Myxococcota bacterium]